MPENPRAKFFQVPDRERDPMLKFLRKYQKWLLVVFGSFLMLVFVAPQAVQQFGKNQLRRTVATLGTAKISVADRQMAAQERQAVKEFLDKVSASDAAVAFVSGDHTDHWLLLTHAAEQGGFVGEAPDGRDFLDSLAQPLAIQLGQFFSQQLQQAGSDFDQMPSDEELINTARQQIEILSNSAAASARLTPNQFEKAMAKARGIFRMYDAYIRAATPSDRAVAIEARQTLDELQSDYIVIPGAYAVPDGFAPTEDQLTEHFQTYRAVMATEGDLGIGYVLPPRVKLEWLKLDRTDIVAAITADPIEVAAEYRRNPDRYPQDRAEAYAQIEQMLRNASADALMDAADTIIRGEVLGVRRRLKADGRYRIIPDDWQRPSLADLAQQVQQQLATDSAFEGATIPLPEYQIRDTRWLTSNDLRGLEGIGIAIVRLGGQQLPFAQVVLSVREIAGDNDLVLQTRMPAVDTRANDPYTGDRYYFTILDSRSESAADTLNEVREQVVKDMRSIAGFEQLKAMLPELIALAAADDGGLTAVADRFNPAPELDESPDDADEPSADESPAGDDPSDQPAEDLETDEEPDDTPAETDAVAVETEPEAVDDDALAEDVSTNDDTPIADPLPPLFPVIDVMVRPGRVHRISPEQMAQFRQQFGQLPPDFDTDARINTDDFRESLFAIARRIDPTAAMGDSLTVTDRTTGLALPRSLSVVVARINGYRPLTVERYRLQVEGVMNLVRQREIGFIGDAFGFEALAARLDYTPTEPRDDDDPAPAAAGAGGN